MIILSCKVILVEVIMDIVYCVCIVLDAVFFFCVGQYLMVVMDECDKCLFLMVLMLDEKGFIELYIGVFEINFYVKAVMDCIFKDY